MYDITHFTLADMTNCGARLREMSPAATSMEQAAGDIVRHLYENLQGSTGRASVMVRLYKTHAYGDLPEELRDFSRAMMPTEPLLAKTKCLTLLATAGDLPEWNDRHASRRHRSIPLPSRRAVEQIPMIAQMLQQFGIEISSLVDAEPQVIREMDHKTHRVFYVPDTHITGPYIPAQAEFVIPYGIKSALGFGGMLPTGNLFAVILFTRVAIPMETARMFRTIALNVKLNILRFAGGKIFAD
jgi:hypothetical protein